MKSVGECMAIGRTFAEILQKALRSLETGLTGLDEIEIEGLGAATTRTPSRRRSARRRPTACSRWRTPCGSVRPRGGLRQLQDRPLVPRAAARHRRHGGEGAGARPAAHARRLPQLKSMGFSDARLAVLSGASEAEVKRRRRALDVRPVFKRIDTCAAEFASPTPYMYSTYAPPFAGSLADEAQPTDAKKVVILGGGPNRIGQGIEFDYCCCHAAFALKDAGYETIMINCNPETVSTDYDTSDRLYFRAPHRRGRARDHRRGALERHPARGHRPVRRPDPAQARERAGSRAGADPRHLARRHRPRGGS
jgi:carbamoyl-phosphate synthase large subunit